MGRKRRTKMLRDLAPYPSISGAKFEHFDEPCMAFRKYDGSNLQFHWRANEGWCRQGTRRRTIDAENPLFGEAIELFQRIYAAGILSAVRRSREYRNPSSIVAFCEFFGERTFSGLHRDGDPKQLVLFDLIVDEHGCIPPNDFRYLLGNLPIAETVYEGPLTREFARSVRNGEYSVGEGVVAKGVSTTQRRRGKSERSVWMAKIKTRKWLDELANRAGEDSGLQRELDDNLAEQSVFGE